MKIFLELTYMMVSECEQCKEPHTYPKPYRKLCEECEPKGENNMSNGTEPWESTWRFTMADTDLQRKERIVKFISEVVYAEYEEGVDEGDLAPILLKFWEFLDTCEAERQRE